MLFRIFQDKDKGDLVNVWVQTFAIILAGGWAIYTFIYQEIYKPYLAPAHLTASFDLVPQVQSDANKDAISLNFSVENTGHKLVYILPSMYTVWGVKLNSDDSKDSNVISSVVSALNDPSSPPDRWSVMHYNWDQSQYRVIAAGQIFKHHRFEAGESKNSNVVIHVPTGEYDLVYGQLWLLGAEHEHELTVKWRENGQIGAIFGVYAKNKLLVADESNDDKEVLEKYGLLMLPDTAVLAL